MTGPGGDRPPPATGVRSFNRWLAGGVPTFVGGLLVANFGQNPWFVLPALGLAAVYGVWLAPTVAHGPLIQRWMTPTLVLAYTAFLVVITLVPDLPLVWQVTVPAALFAAVALAAARSYGDTGILLALGIAATGVGIAAIGVGIAAILDRPGHRRDLGHRRRHRGHRRRHRAPPRPRPPGGIAGIGVGIAGIGAGIWVWRARRAARDGAEADAAMRSELVAPADADPIPFPLRAWRRGGSGGHARPD